MDTYERATLSESLDYILGQAEAEIEKDYEDHVSADQFEKLTEGLVDSSLYDDFISPEDFDSLTENLVDLEELNWDDHGEFLNEIFPEGEMVGPDVDTESLHDGEDVDVDFSGVEYFPEFAEEFTIYGLPEQYTTD